jgi:4-amino-4-deoxy-L-arabinose transferase-like glycosyltransferase
LGLRVAHVLALRNSPYFSRPVLDAETYFRAASALAAGDGWAEPVYWQPPGYPYFLAAVLWLWGPGFLAPRLVQAILGALTAALTCAVGARVFGRGVGIAAGLIVAVYGLLIYYDGELLAPSLAICLQMATLYAAVRAPGE